MHAAKQLSESEIAEELCACRHRKNLPRSFKGRCFLICLILPEIFLLSFLQRFHLLCLSPGGVTARREVQVVTGICMQGTAYATSWFSWTKRPHKLFGLMHWPKKSSTSTFSAPHPLWKGSQGRLGVCSLMLHICSRSGEHLPKAWLLLSTPLLKKCSETSSHLQKQPLAEWHQ